jgi:lipid-A-disaccharide synthase
MRRFVDHVLCALPFEEPWYRERGVKARYVGHPYFDELPRQELDADFRANQQSPGEKIIGLLPGSRTLEVELNLSTLVKAASLIHAQRPDTRFLLACFKPAHLDHAERYLRDQRMPFIVPCVNRTPEIIDLAHACIAVSGSVGLELLYRNKPSVVVYRIRPYHIPVFRLLQKTRYIGLVNLLADSELFPEFLSHRCEAGPVAEQILHWLNDAQSYQKTCADLAALLARVAVPGACERAAAQIIKLSQEKIKLACVA